MTTEKSDLIASLHTLQTTNRRDTIEREALKSQLDAAQRAAASAAEQYATDAAEASTQFETLQSAYDEMASELAAAKAAAAAAATATATASASVVAGSSPAPKSNSLLPPPAAQALRSSHSALDMYVFSSPVNKIVCRLVNSVCRCVSGGANKISKFDFSKSDGKSDGAKSPLHGIDRSGAASPVSSAVANKHFSPPPTAASGGGSSAPLTPPHHPGDSKRSSLTLPPPPGVLANRSGNGAGSEDGVRSGVQVSTTLSSGLHYPNDLVVVPPLQYHRHSHHASGSGSDESDDELEGTRGSGGNTAPASASAPDAKLDRSLIPPYRSQCVTLLVADQFNHCIKAMRAEDGGSVITIAGSSSKGSNDSSNPLLATFDHPQCIAVYRHPPIPKRRKPEAVTPPKSVVSAGVIDGVSGSGAAAPAAPVLTPALAAIMSVLATGTVMQTTGGVSHPPVTAHHTKAGAITIYVSESHRIRRITPTGAVSTFAGSKEKGFADGLGVGAAFNEPKGLCVDPTTGTVYVCDR